MAFGGVAVDERLPGSEFPGLSMICGLIANAMGLCRTNPGDIQELQDGMEIASRLDRPGTCLRDYQTASLNSADEMWTARGVVEGRGGGSSGEFTVQLYKDYWADRSVTVAVALPDSRIDVVASALERPARPIFLGRACCPPSRPTLLGVEDHADVLAAVQRAPIDPEVRHVLGLQAFKFGKPCRLRAQWPSTIVSEFESRRDIVSDIKDWANRIHRGQRIVCEGEINVEEPAHV
jgi:CRISPR system Cascade subunit CasD